MTRRSTSLRLLAGVAVGFLIAIAAVNRTADPATRLPARYRLADLIHSEQRTTAALRTEVAELRADVAELREASNARQGGTMALEARLDDVGEVAGFVAVAGPGLRVTLDDAEADEPPDGGTVNDLVVHSQDVQAVVNALWRSGAEAIAINGQRLVATSAVLCVGNTLLLNGTVHSPPYVASAVGASRDRFDADPLVRRLRADAKAYGLRFSVERATTLDIPAYRGAVRTEHAEPVPSTP